MIVVEERLTEAFEQLPEIDGFKPFYDWGNKYQLIKQMDLFSKESKSIYPLIYQTSTGSNQNEIARICETKLVLILACRNTEVDLTNKERWALSYRNILNPLLVNIITCFNKAGIFNWDGKYRIDNLPNYGDGDKNETVDIWDAIRFEITSNNGITINDNCINTIRF